MIFLFNKEIALYFSLFCLNIMYAWRSHFEITYHKKSSSLTFMLNSYKLTFKKRQITIILESLSFLENHEEEKQTTFVWLMRSEKNFASSINIFCACLFCPSVSKNLLLILFLLKKPINFFRFPENYHKNVSKEKMCHEILRMQ